MPADDSALVDLYFHDPRAFVIPIEHLHDGGMSESFATWLCARRDVDDAWVAFFNRAYVLYRERAGELSAKDTKSWFPPRAQNICVVEDADHTRPFYLPFNKASWLMYATDFNPAESHEELACYLLLHIERLCLAQNPAAAVAHNLAYWLARSDDEVSAFAAAAARSLRPDGEAFAALGKALSWVRQMHHPVWRPLTEKPSEPVGQLPQSGVIATASMQQPLVDLVGAFRTSVNEVARSYFARFAPKAGRASELAAWLADAKPDVLVTGADGDILWDPATPDETANVETALETVTEAAAESIRQDIEVAGDRTTRFMNSLRNVDDLPLPGDDIEQSGLTYIHATRRRIAYNLAEPGMNRLAEPAAPYERLMLGARTLHEWAHLAVDAGVVRVPEARRSEYARAELAFVDAMRAIIAAAPVGLAAVAEEERERTGASDLAVGLKDTVLGRAPDYMANMLARRLTSREEMETYVRQQVTTLVQEPLGPFGQLARYSYEMQYLSLSAVEDAMAYFLKSTWFRETFVDAGVVTMGRFETLVAAMADICDCFEIDEATLTEGS